MNTKIPEHKQEAIEAIETDVNFLSTNIAKITVIIDRCPPFNLLYKTARTTVTIINATTNLLYWHSKIHKQIHGLYNDKHKKLSKSFHKIIYMNTFHSTTQQ